MCPCAFLEDRGRGPASYSVTLCLTPFIQDQSLNLELGWEPASPSHPPASTLHSTGVRGMSSYLHGCCDENSGPHPCIANALTHSPGLFHIAKDLSKNTEDIPVKSADGGACKFRGQQSWGMNTILKTYTTNRIQFNWAKHKICYLNQTTAAAHYTNYGRRSPFLSKVEIKISSHFQYLRQVPGRVGSWLYSRGSVT